MALLKNELFHFGTFRVMVKRDPARARKNAEFEKKTEREKL